jgi:hypothetical protein
MYELLPTNDLQAETQKIRRWEKIWDKRHKNFQQTRVTPIVMYNFREFSDLKKPYTVYVAQYSYRSKKFMCWESKDAFLYLREDFEYRLINRTTLDPWGRHYLIFRDSGLIWDRLDKNKLQKADIDYVNLSCNSDGNLILEIFGEQNQLPSKALNWINRCQDCYTQISRLDSLKSAYQYITDHGLDVPVYGKVGWWLWKSLEPKSLEQLKRDILKEEYFRILEDSDPPRPKTSMTS